MHLIAREVRIPNTFNVRGAPRVCSWNIIQVFLHVPWLLYLCTEQRKTSFKVWNEIVFEIEKDLNYWKFCTIFNITKSSLAHTHLYVFYIFWFQLLYLIFFNLETSYLWHFPQICKAWIFYWLEKVIHEANRGDFVKRCKMSKGIFELGKRYADFTFRMNC